MASIKHIMHFSAAIARSSYFLEFCVFAAEKINIPTLFNDDDDWAVVVEKKSNK